MEFSCHIPMPPSDIRLVKLGATDNFSHRWRLSAWPQVIIESTTDPLPWGKAWKLKERVDKGKFRGTGGKYPSTLKLKLESPAKNPEYCLEWITMKGRLAYYRKPSDFISFIPGDEGFLIIAIAVLEVENQ